MCVTFPCLSLTDLGHLMSPVTLLISSIHRIRGFPTLLPPLLQQLFPALYLSPRIDVSLSLVLNIFSILVVDSNEMLGLTFFSLCNIQGEKWRESDGSRQLNNIFDIVLAVFNF